VIVLNETHLRLLLRDYLTYYHRDRTHLSLEKDAPEPRPVSAPTRAESSRYPRSEACIIGTHGWLRKVVRAHSGDRPRSGRFHVFAWLPSAPRLCL
jgi:hypothetical protein